MLNLGDPGEVIPLGQRIKGIAGHDIMPDDLQESAADQDQDRDADAAVPPVRERWTPALREMAYTELRALLTWAVDVDGGKQCA